MDALVIARNWAWTLLDSGLGMDALVVARNQAWTLVD